MAPHSSTLAWKIPWMEQPGRLQSMGSRRVGHSWVTSLSLFTFMHWRRNGNPFQCSCLENPREGGAWWAAIYGVAQSWTWLKQLSTSSSRDSVRFIWEASDNDDQGARCCCCSVVKSCLALCNAMDCSIPGLAVPYYLLELPRFMITELVILSNHLLLCCPLLLLPKIFPSIRVFSNESAVQIRWPKYWHFSFSSSPSKEYSGLISLRIDWFDLFAVQGTLKILLQHCTSKASIVWCSAFFIVQLSYPYMTTGKTIALTRRAFVGKVMSLLFNILSRLVLTFLQRSKFLFISWLQSPSAMILEPPK